ncbi:MAG: fluoride efflux transporter CrcB [Arenicellales bacterium WSBS_2016_MAG_OTU3]
MKEILIIAAAGSVGAVSRFLMMATINARLPAALPLGTVSVNVIGSFAAGFFAVLLLDRADVSDALKHIILIGFLGSFTTFSTFSLDTFRLLEKGQTGLALANIFANVVFCLLATAFGFFLARRFNLS